VIWIANIAGIASGIGYGLERAFKNGATVRLFLLCQPDHEYFFKELS